MATAGPASVKAAAIRWLEAPHYTLVVKPYPRLSPGQTTVDRKVLPPLGATPDVNFPAVQRTTLSNGLSVILLERHSTPIVNLALAVDAGYAADVSAKAGLASLALGLMDEGTLDARHLPDRGRARRARRAAHDRQLARPLLRATAGAAREPPAVAADHGRRRAQPRLPGRSRRAREAAAPGADPAGEAAADCRGAARAAADLCTAPGTPTACRFTGSGHEETIETLTRNDLAAWHEAWFHPNRSTIIATGDVTMAQLAPALEKAFGGWARGEAPAKRLDAVPRASGGKVYLIDRPDAPQSVIVAAHVSDAGGQPEDMSIQTVMRNFGGISTSRLNRNLRLDKHWSYGASAQLAPARGPRPFFVVAPVQTDKTKEAMVEVAKELRDVAGERPMAGEELAERDAQRDARPSRTLRDDRRPRARGSRSRELRLSRRLLRELRAQRPRPRRARRSPRPRQSSSGLRKSSGWSSATSARSRPASASCGSATSSGSTPTGRPRTDPGGPVNPTETRQ